MRVSCYPAKKKPHIYSRVLFPATVVITAELDFSSYRVREGDGNITVCVLTDRGLPEAVQVQLGAFELLEGNNATGV